MGELDELTIEMVDELLKGWDKKYPRLPEILLRNNCPECKNSIGATIYFEGISKKLK